MEPFKTKDYLMLIGNRDFHLSKEKWLYIPKNFLNWYSFLFSPLETFSFLLSPMYTSSMLGLHRLVIYFLYLHVPKRGKKISVQKM